MPSVSFMPGFEENKADALGARRHIHLRRDETDPPVKGLPGIGIGSDDGGITQLNPADVGLIDLRIHPYRGEVGNRVKFGLRLHVHVGKGVTLGDVARYGRVDRQLAANLAGGFQTA